MCKGRFCSTLPFGQKLQERILQWEEKNSSRSEVFRMPDRPLSFICTSIWWKFMNYRQNKLTSLKFVTEAILHCNLLLPLLTLGVREKRLLRSTSPKREFTP